MIVSQIREHLQSFLRVIVPGRTCRDLAHKGFNWKHSISKGIKSITALYRTYNQNELKIILINLGAEPFEIKRGDRIAQLIIAPVQLGRMVEVSELDETVRGIGGFGSTGMQAV